MENLPALGLDRIACNLLTLLCWAHASYVLVCFSGVAIGFVTDRFRGRMKATILVLYAVCTVAFLLFALVIFNGASTGAKMLVGTLVPPRGAAAWPPVGFRGVGSGGNDV